MNVSVHFAAAHFLVLRTGIEPASTVPETVVLSIERPKRIDKHFRTIQSNLIAFLIIAREEEIYKKSRTVSTQGSRYSTKCRLKK